MEIDQAEKILNANEEEPLEVIIDY